jgi:hypothetical protein
MRSRKQCESVEHIDGFVAMLIGHKETLNMMDSYVEPVEYDDYLDGIYR